MTRVAIVTGGTRGIGRAISTKLKEDGFQVAANYGGNDEAAQKFQDEEDIPVYKWDVGDYESCERGVQKVEADLGPIDTVVNNAGITRDGMFHKMSEDDWKSVIDVHLHGSFNVTRAAVEHFREQEDGSFVLFTSTSGLIGNIGQANYAAAKMGIAG